MTEDWHKLVSQPKYEIQIEEDVWVTMRDGVRLCVDVFRPKAEGRFPALVSYSWCGKDQQKLPSCPTWQKLNAERGNGQHECGEQWYYVPRGYVQVIPDIRGVAKSEGRFGEGAAQDGYDLIEWIAAQPWCNGNVGMIGMSSFAGPHYHIAATQPPHLKAIFPFEASSDHYRYGSYDGGILQYLFSIVHGRNELPVLYTQPASFKEFSKEELAQKIKELQRNPDIRSVPYLYVLTQKPELHPRVFDALMHPYDGPFYQARAPYKDFKNIKVPAFAGSRWNGWNLHLPGAFKAYDGIATDKKYKKLFIIPSDNLGGMDRPYHEVQDVCLRWYDHWLKGNDTGMMSEPPILIFVQGVNQWRYENEWPLKATQWTKFYLRENGRLSREIPKPGEAPQVFTTDPWAVASEGTRSADPLVKADPVPKAIYETEPLKENLEVTGPLALYWYAAIESAPLKVRSWAGSAQDGTHEIPPLSNDTDWYLKVLDIDVDGGERVVALGWLKASHYELDETKSTEYEPYHPHSRSLKIEPDEIIRYASDVRMMSNVFLAGHRIRLEISGQDQTAFVWYHLPHMAEVTHRIYSVPEQPSFLLLPVIPKGYQGAGQPEHLPDGPFRLPKYKRP